MIIRTLLLPFSMDATNSIGVVNINGPVVGPSIASVVEKHVGATRKNSVQFIRKASRSNSIATEMSPDQIRAEARELVEVVREMTGVALPYIFYSLASLSYEYVFEFVAFSDRIESYGLTSYCQNSLKLRLLQPRKVGKASSRSSQGIGQASHQQCRGDCQVRNFLNIRKLHVFRLNIGIFGL